MSFVAWCERCEAEGIRSPVALFQINDSEAVKMCARRQCRDCLNYWNNLSAVIVKRSHLQCVTKAPVSDPAEAIEPSSVSGPSPQKDPYTTHGPAACPTSRVAAILSSCEAKASDASEVCCGGQMRMAEAVSLPLPKTVELSPSGSAVPTMPTRIVPSTDACEVSLVHVGSADVAGDHLEPGEPCRRNAPPPSANSCASGENSSLPVATCGGSEQLVPARLVDAAAGIAATRTASPAQVNSNGEERRYGECGAAAVTLTVQGAERRNSQVQVAASVSGDNSVPSTVLTAPNEASEKLVAAAIPGDSDVSTCFSGGPPVILQRLLAGGEKEAGHCDIPALHEANSDLSVSGCADAGECNPGVSTDPIASSLWIAETMFSLQCGRPQVAKNSLGSEDSAAAMLQSHRACGVQFDSTDCVGIKESAHQYQSEGTQYVDLEPCSSRLPEPSLGPPPIERKGSTTVQAAVACLDGGGGRGAGAVPAAEASACPTSGSTGTSPPGSVPCTVPAQRTPAAVASMPGDASTGAVPKKALAGRAVPPTAPNTAVASSPSGRPARRPGLRTPNRWASSGRRAAASNPARTDRTRDKREASPPQPQLEVVAPESGSCYVKEKFAKITEALKKLDQAPRCTLPGRNKPENKRMPGMKRRRDDWSKRQAGPQSQRPPSPKKVLKLAFGRPPKLRRKCQAEQVVPDVLHPALSPTPSDYSSPSSKPSSNCPSSPASCVSGGSDYSSTSTGSSGASRRGSLQLMDCQSEFPPYQFTERVMDCRSEFPPYKVTERVKAPVKVARRGRPAKKGPTDVHDEIDRYISELSHSENSSQFDSILSDLF